MTAVTRRHAGTFETDNRQSTTDKSRLDVFCTECLRFFGVC